MTHNVQVKRCFTDLGRWLVRAGRLTDTVDIALLQSLVRCGLVATRLPRALYAFIARYRGPSASKRRSPKRLVKDLEHLRRSKDAVLLVARALHQDSHLHQTHDRIIGRLEAHVQ